MGQYQYNERDDMNYSANKLRMEMEERIRQEEYQRYLEKIDSESKMVTGPAKKMIERTVRKAVMSDDIGRGLREASMAVGMVTSVAAGIALCVASCASDAAYNNSIERAMKDYEADRQSQIQRAVDDSMNRQSQKLSELSESVAEKRRELDTAQNSYYVEYRETRQEAQQAISAARDTYNQEKAEIKKEYERADQTMKSSMGAVTEQYKRDVDRINSEYPAGAQRDAEILRATERRDTEMQKISDTHRDEVQRLKDRTATAETNFNSIVDHQKDIISVAQIKRDEGIEASRNSLSNAQTRLDSFQSQMSSREDMERSVLAHVASNGDKVDAFHGVVAADKDVRGEVAAAGAALMSMNINELRTHANAAIENSLFNSGSTVEARFASVIANNHQNLGKEIAMQLGSSEEKDILTRASEYKSQVKQYEIDCQKADSQGLPRPSAPKPPADYNKADAIVQKYAGSLNSEKDLKQTIDMMKKSANEITLQNEKIQKNIDSAKKELSSLNSQATAIEKKLSQLQADHKLLERGKGADGVKLTSSQRKEIMTRVSGADVAGLQKQLLDIKTKQKSINNDIKANNNLIANKNALISAIDKHTNRLKDNGKAIVNTARKSQPVALFGGILKDENNNALIKLKYKDKNGNWKEITKKAKDPNKSGNKMQKKGINMIFNSVSKISSEAKKELNKGNALQNELMKNARSMSQMARKYELAIGVGHVAVKALGGVGSFVKKIGGNTRLGKSLKSKFESLSNNAAFKKFTKIAGITKNSGRAIGGKLLKAPSTILKAPMKIMNAPQTLAKGAVKVAWRTTRKITGVTVKGTKKVTKKIAKHTVGKTKFGKNISKVFSSISNKFNAFKQSLKKLNPISFLKKKLTAILSSILSALGSLLSLLGTVVAYIAAAGAGFLGFVLIILIIAALLLSIINAIVNWLKSLGAGYDTYVRNHPNYILNQAVNYRYEEIQILESFSGKSLVPSTNPIEYSKMSWWMFGVLTWDDMRELQKSGDPSNIAYNEKYADVLLTSQNNGAYNKLNSLGITFDSGHSYDLSSFTDFLRQYDKTTIKYYPYDAYKDGSLNGDTPSNYEISNAKDVLALVDTLYQDAESTAQNEKEKMQIHEVLAYLGIGDYRQRIRNKDDSIHYKDNLFWRTHELVYQSGTTTNEIKYHVSTKNANNENNYYVNPSYIYSDDGTYSSTYVSGLACDSEHQKTLNLQYTTTTYETVHKTVNDFDWENRDEFIIDSEVVYNQDISAQKLTAAQLYYYTNSDNYYSWNEPTSTTASGVYRTVNGVKNWYTYDLKDWGYNYASGSELSKLQGMLNSSESDRRVTLYRRYGTYYRVVDSDGYYLGTYNIKSDDGGNLYNMITQFQNGNTTIYTNMSDNSYYGTNLEAFFLMWDATNQEFSFKFVGNKNYSTAATSINTAVSLNNGNLCTYRMPYFEGAKITPECNCTPIENKDTKDFVYTYCTGHLNLNVGVVVTTIDDGDALFEAARNMDTFEEWSKSKDDKTFLGIVIYSKDDYASGFGGYTLRKFVPSTDWKVGSKLIDTAKAKAAVDHEYEIDAEDGAFDADEQTIKIKDTYQSLTVSSDNKLLMLLRVANNNYYVYSFTSGEQKGLRLDNGSGTQSKYDIKVTSNGKLDFTPSLETD